MKYLLFFSCFIFTTFTYAQSGSGPADDWRKKARESRNVTISGGSVSGGNYRGNVNTRIDTGGSSSTVKTPISFPTNPATNAKSLADVAKKMAKGGAVAAGVAVAVDVILDGVDFVLDPKNNSIVRPHPDLSDSTYSSSYQYKCRRGGTPIVDTVKECGQIFRDDMYKSYPQVIVQSCAINNPSDIYCTFGEKGKAGSNYQVADRVARVHPEPENQIIDASQVQDAFGEWLANNPHSITDPVVTPMYIPEYPLGQGINGFPVFPSAEMSDEILDTMIQNRDNQLWIEETGGGQLSTIGSPNESSTSKDQTGSSTETKTNPDGSTTTTTTEKTVDADTGEITTTTTTTTTKSDGSQETSSSTKKESAAKPEVTELPAVCDYFSFLCNWYERYKSDSDAHTKHAEEEKSFWKKITDFFDSDPDSTENTELEINEEEKIQDSVSVSFAGHQCPSLSHRIDWLNADLDFSPVYLCDLANKLYFFFVSLGGYIASRIISRGAS